MRLCLTEQKLTRIEGLALPSLRDLQLHNNQVRGEGQGARLAKAWIGRMLTAACHHRSLALKGLRAAQNCNGCGCLATRSV